jgi:FkbM family methyltransferase
MRRLLASISRSGLVRSVARGLKLHRLANWWLGKFPVRKELPGGIVYRATRVESIPLGVEMFDKSSLYDVSLFPPCFTNFIDLGCNVGYFTCLLASMAQGRKLNGLMLDANPHAVREAQWHADANELGKVIGIHGIVGEGKFGDLAKFYLYESNICSTSHMSETGLPGKWEEIRVPCVCIEEQWEKNFPGQRCHLLKIDVEGSEMNFLKAEKSFLASVDAILLEWHKWGTSLDALNDFLKVEGFKLVKVLEETETMGTAYFRK